MTPPRTPRPSSAGSPRSSGGHRSAGASRRPSGASPRSSGSSTRSPGESPGSPEGSPPSSGASARAHRSSPRARAEDAVELALEEGFELAGVAPLAPPPAAERFRRWLAAGRHAGMRWLERDAERITDPRRVLPEGRSLLVVGSSHARPAVELPGGGRVARYAAGRDYHNALGKRLRRLARRLARFGLVGRSRALVDAGPLLERSHAAVAGIGFESKAANLLHPRLGPWFFLGELLLEAELEPTAPPESAPPIGSCGTCRACIDACPTGALVEPGVLDANLCISYHTIENRGPVPHELREETSEWAFGCDVCSEVCPFGSRAGAGGERLGTHPAVAEASLADWLRTPTALEPERFRGSALRRARRDGLARNAALALGRHPSAEGRAALEDALGRDPSPMVRESAGWGLARGHGADAGVRERLSDARARETDPAAREGLARTLEEL